MSEVRLVVREGGRDWSGTMHGGWANRAIAALSADPATLEELEAAVTRFAKPAAHHDFLVNLSPGLWHEPHDAGLELNRDFGNLREILHGSDAALAAALIDPVLENVTETLTTISAARPDLALQCESLVDGLHKLLDPRPPEPTWEGDDLGSLF